jgi:hypothetical protein
MRRSKHHAVSRLQSLPIFIRVKLSSDYPSVGKTINANDKKEAENLRCSSMSFRRSVNAGDKVEFLDDCFGITGLGHGRVEIV